MGPHPHPVPEFSLSKPPQVSVALTFVSLHLLALQRQSGFSWTSGTPAAQEPSACTCHQGRQQGAPLPGLCGPLGSAQAWPCHLPPHWGTELPALCPAGFLSLVANGIRGP